MEVMLIKKSMHTNTRRFQPGEIYLMFGLWKQQALNVFHKKGLNDIVNFFNLNDIISPLRYTDIGISDILMFNGGGIGDIIALTAIMNLFPNARFHIVCPSKHHDLKYWMGFDVKWYDLYDPFLTLPPFAQYGIVKLNKWRYFSSVGTIECGDNRNWYEVFFDIIGGAGLPDYYHRPILLRKKQENILPRPTLLIINKASCMMRTIPLAEIISALPSKIENRYQIWAYKNDDNLIPGIFNYLKTESLNQFLDILYDVDMVISVDTSAIHFREAVGKPCIGLFNSFTVESRAKYYKYTKSFDIASSCPDQPCFRHDTQTIRHCKHSKAFDFAPPCFRSETNPMLKEQLREIFENNL